MAAQYPETNKFYTSAAGQARAGRPDRRLAPGAAYSLCRGLLRAAHRLRQRRRTAACPRFAPPRRRLPCARRSAPAACEIVRQVLVESLLSCLSAEARSALALSDAVSAGHAATSCRRICRASIRFRLTATVLAFTIVWPPSSPACSSELSRRSAHVAPRSLARSARRHTHRDRRTQPASPAQHAGDRGNRARTGVAHRRRASLFAASCACSPSIPASTSAMCLLPTSAILQARHMPTEVAQFYDQLLPQVAALPGVKSAAAGWPLPFSGSNIGVGFDIEGRPTAVGEMPGANVRIVTPELLQHPSHSSSARSRLRSQPIPERPPPSSSSTRPSPPNSSPVRTPSASTSSRASTTAVHPEAMREIVAVVGDVKQGSLTKRRAPNLLSPAYPVRNQRSDACPAHERRSRRRLTTPLRTLIGSINRDVPLYHIHTLEDMLSRRRVAAALSRRCCSRASR